jgi:integrase-like protein
MVLPYTAVTLDFFCGLHACEIKELQWKHISWEDRRFSVRRSKAPAGWRDPSLNDTCLEALRQLHGRADRLALLNVSTSCSRGMASTGVSIPRRAMTSWGTAWRSLRKAADLPHVRFQDGRHTAVTRLAEEGVPDCVIRAQFGRVSPAMTAVYSHVRRMALDEAAKALAPEATAAVPPPLPEPPTTADADQGVMSHVTSQQRPRRSNVINLRKEVVRPARLELATSWFVAVNTFVDPVQLTNQTDPKVGRHLDPILDPKQDPLGIGRSFALAPEGAPALGQRDPVPTACV